MGSNLYSFVFFLPPEVGKHTHLHCSSISVASSLVVFTGCSFSPLLFVVVLGRFVVVLGLPSGVSHCGATPYVRTYVRTYVHVTKKTKDNKTYYSAAAPSPLSKSVVSYTPKTTSLHYCRPHALNLKRAWGS